MNSITDIEKKIDAALDSVLNASTLDDMRKAMREVITKAYMKGSADCFKSLIGGEEHDRNRALNRGP